MIKTFTVHLPNLRPFLSIRVESIPAKTLSGLEYMHSECSVALSIEQAIAFQEDLHSKIREAIVKDREIKKAAKS